MTYASEGRQFDMRLAYAALIAGGTIAAINFGIRSGFGLYMEPISDKLGTGREVFSLAMAVQNLMWGLAQPFAGALADRFGPFKVLFWGGFIYAGGTAWMAVASDPLSFHLSTGVLIGAALAGTSFGLILSAVGQLFPPEKRSWAIGITAAAGSFGQFVFVPATRFMIDWVGWEETIWIGAAIALLMVPLSFVYRSVPPGGSAGASTDQSFGEALSEAFAYRSYWLLIGGFFVCGFHVAFIAVHLPSYVVDIGLSKDLGAWTLSLVGLFNVIGAYSAGVLGGKYSKRWLLSSLYLSRAVLITIFILTPPTTASVLIFGAVMGLLWLSTVPLTSSLVGQIFGTRYMSTLFGVVFLSHQLGAFLGVWLGGRLFDATGSYDLIWWIAIGLSLFSGLVHIPIREQPILRVSA